MSESYSTTAAGGSKPAKPYPSFPLTAHPTRRWCKKIKGKLRYFGRWDDPEGALREYEAFLAGTVVEQATTADNRADATGKPSKPYPDFPLTAHPTGQWCKKIRGKIHYFGPWDDPDGALNNYLASKDDLHAGRTPRPDTAAATVKEVVNAFLNFKKGKLDSGELSLRTWQGYKEITDLLVKHLGKGRLVTDLHPEDFSALRRKVAKKWGVYGLSRFVQGVRSVFKHAFDSRQIDSPLHFGPDFARPSKKTMRLHRTKQGPKLFTAEEVRRLTGTALTPVRAMILLGINCGMGNSDCANLPLRAVDLDGGFIDFPRPKTGIARRCPLWPETVAAIREALAKRPKAKSEEDADLLFLTRCGVRWAKVTTDSDTRKVVANSPLTGEMRKLLRKLGINGHRNFYTLRHTFRTVADESKDQPAVDFIMGHEVPHMSAVYRETISDERLQAVADHVRRWLFPSTASIKSGE
jgi:integrase